MQLTNDKLVDRGTRYVMEGLGVSYSEAAELLERHGSVLKAIDSKG